MLELEEVIDATLYQNKKVFPTEIVYEVTTRKNKLPFGIAIADILQSIPHYHRVTHETYTVVQGELEVTLGVDKHLLRVGDVITIPPGAVHSARSTGSQPARITVTTIPEWSPEDHHVVSDSEPN